MSRPITLPSGKVVYAAFDWRWFNRAPEKERREFLEALEALVEAAERRAGNGLQEEESQAVQ